jgi:hypothetical protein
MQIVLLGLGGLMPFAALGSRGAFFLHPGPVGIREPVLDDQRDVLIDGTGVGLFLRHAQLRQHVEDHCVGDFEFAGQLVDSNLLHSVDAGQPVTHCLCA